MGGSLSKEDKQKIVNEKFFGVENNIFTLKESDFANKESMPFYDVIMYLKTLFVKTQCSNVNDMVIFCNDNNSNQLSEEWKKKWSLYTNEERQQMTNQCSMIEQLNKAKQMCAKDNVIEYSTEMLLNLFDNDDMKNIMKYLSEQDVDKYIDSAGKIDDKNKVIQSSLEYAADNSKLFNNNMPINFLKKMLGSDFNLSTNAIIYFAENFVKVYNELSSQKSVQKGGMMVIDNTDPTMIVLLELKNRYINHISALKSKTLSIVNNLQAVKVSDFESDLYAPYYNEVKNMGASYSFQILVNFLPQANQLFSTLKNDMIQNPEDYFNNDGKLIDKKHKLINHINLALNNSEKVKEQFKEYFNLINKPTLELALSILRLFQPNMTNDERITLAKKHEIQQNIKNAALFMQTAGNSNTKHKRIQSIRKIIRKNALRKILSKTRK
jgi:hypothetical protein